MLVSIRGLGARDDARQSGVSRAGWIAIIIGLVVGAMLANVSAFQLLLPPWDPVLYLFGLFSPLTALDLLVMSLLLILVGLSLKSGSRRAGWVALMIALTFGVVLANLSGLAFPPLDPCWGVFGCPPWNPGPFGPPIWTLLHTATLPVLVVLCMSILLRLIGFFLAWRTRDGLTPMLVRGLQLAPLLVVTLIGLAALFLFPLPYAL